MKLTPHGKHMEPNVLILGCPKSYRLSMTTSLIDGVRIGGNSHDVIIK